MPTSVEESYDYCRALARRTGRNFYYSFLTLPRDRFRAMCVLYAFMRVTDDLGDSDEPAETRKALLAGWRENVILARNGTVAAHPVLPALVEVVRQYQVPFENLLDVITGVETDLQPAGFETFAQLQDYCYLVAGAVGLACIRIWGFHDSRALAAAVDCGTAFQLTNILRDLGEDARRGRVYLPREDLLRFELVPDDLARGIRDERFSRLMEFEVSRAREYYARAQALFAYLDPPGQPILETMLRIYGGLLDEIERRKFDVFTRRVELSRCHKLCLTIGIVARHKIFALFGK